jgi:hypothetical protein
MYHTQMQSIQRVILLDSEIYGRFMLKASEALLHLRALKNFAGST